MEKAIIYIHGKGGNIKESTHYEPLFHDYDIIGFDFKSETPWEAKRRIYRLYQYDMQKLRRSGVARYVSTFLCL